MLSLVTQIPGFHTGPGPTNGVLLLTPLGLVPPEPAINAVDGRAHCITV